MVRPEDLTPGNARFQCTGCQTYFAFSWPQPPGTLSVRAEKISARDFSPASPPVAVQSVNTTQSKVTRVCFNCGEKVDAKYIECTKCGVLFDKVRKIKSPEPVMQAAGPEIIAAWEAVKTNYADEKRHESFIQLSLSRDSLPFASSQYRAILLVNPNDEIAKRMQNRIIDLATTTYIAAQTALRGDVSTRSRSLSSVAIVFAAVFVVIGVTVAALRPLVAVGVSILAFVFVLKALNKRS